MDKFENNEDILRTATLQDSDGSAFDTANFLTIIVKVVHKIRAVEIGEYTLAGGTITRELPTTDGIISFIVPITDLTGEPLGIYEYQIHTTETDLDYSSNVRDRNFIGDCFELIGSL